MKIDINKIVTYLYKYKDNIKYNWQFDSKPFKKFLPLDSSYPDNTSDLEANFAFKEFVYTHFPNHINIQQQYPNIHLNTLNKSPTLSIKNTI